MSSDQAATIAEATEEARAAIAEETRPFADFVRGDKVWHVGYTGRRMTCVVVGPTPLMPAFYRSYTVRVTSHTSARYGYKHGDMFDTNASSMIKR